MPLFTIAVGHFTAIVRTRRSSYRKGMELKSVHECGCQMRRAAFCPICGEVSPGSVRLGFEYNDGQIVMLSQQDLIECRPESSKVLNIIGFVSLEKIHPMGVSDTYYLEPVSDSAGLCGEFEEALLAEGRAGLTQVTIGRRERTGLICPIVGSGLVLHVLWADDELQPVPVTYAGTCRPEGSRVDDLRTVICRLAVPEVEPYPDRFQTAIRDLVERRLNHRPESDQGNSCVSLAA